MRSRQVAKTKLKLTLIITALAALGAFAIFCLLFLKESRQTKIPLTLSKPGTLVAPLIKGTPVAGPSFSMKIPTTQLSESVPQEAISDVRRRVLGADPFLRKIKQFQTVVLPSQGDFVDMEKMLSDTERILSVQKDLSWSGSLSRDSTLRNMYQLDFLGMAISWHKNPARAEALDSLEAIVTFQPNSVDSGDEELIRAAERFEAATALFKHAPANFERLTRDNTSPSLRKILDEVRIRNQSSHAPLVSQKG